MRALLAIGFGATFCVCDVCRNLQDEFCAIAKLQEDALHLHLLLPDLIGVSKGGALACKLGRSTKCNVHLNSTLDHKGNTQLFSPPHPLPSLCSIP